MKEGNKTDYIKSGLLMKKYKDESSKCDVLLSLTEVLSSVEVMVETDEFEPVLQVTICFSIKKVIQ